MQAWILFAIMIGALVVVGIGVVLFVLVRNLRLAQGPATAGKYPQGHWMGIGMAIGLPIGYFLSLLMGVLTDNTTSFIALGPAIGCGLGVALGSALEQRHKNEVRPLTEKEQKIRSWAVGIGLLLAFLGVLALMGTLLIASR